MPTPAHAPPHAAPHACPRCDYDLSGETSRWEASCPTLGMCPECGLTFAWRDILVPARRRLRGFVEHEIEPMRVLAAMPRTAAWALRPGAFWGRVTLFMPIRLRRAALLVGVLSSLAILGAIMANRFSTVALPIPFLEVFVAFMLAESLIIPITLLLLPDTRKIAKVHAKHVGRAAFYSLMWIPVFGLPLFGALLIGILSPASMMPAWRGLLWGATPGTTLAWIAATGMAVTCLWIIAWFVLWWRGAIRSWRLPSPWPVAIALLIIAFLTMMIFVAPTISARLI